MLRSVVGQRLSQGLKSFWWLFMFLISRWISTLVCCVRLVSSSLWVRAAESGKNSFSAFSNFLTFFSGLFGYKTFSLPFPHISHCHISRTQNSAVRFIALVGSIFPMSIGRRNAAGEATIRTWKCFWMSDKRLLESSNESGENWNGTKNKCCIVLL